MEVGFKQLLAVNKDLHNKILCYEPIWIEDLKENLKQHNVSIGMQKLQTFLDDKVRCIKYIFILLISVCVKYFFIYKITLQFV